MPASTLVSKHTKAKQHYTLSRKWAPTSDATDAIEHAVQRKAERAYRRKFGTVLKASSHVKLPGLSRKERKRREAIVSRKNQDELGRLREMLWEMMTSIPSDRPRNGFGAPRNRR
jgi:hypothetical protein